MNTMTYHFIRIGQAADGEQHAKRPLYWIVNRSSSESIGQIFYYPQWRQWVARFDPDSMWSAGCLADVADAIAKITAEGKPNAPLFGEAAG